MYLDDLAVVPIGKSIVADRGERLGHIHHLYRHVSHIPCSWNRGHRSIERILTKGRNSLLDDDLFHTLSLTIGIISYVLLRHGTLAGDDKSAV